MAASCWPINILGNELHLTASVGALLIPSDANTICDLQRNAEKSGLISALGDWVLLTACKEVKSWIDNGLQPRSIAVNISAAQMLQADFIARVKRCLQQSQLPPHLLFLELTESLFVGKSMQTIQRLLNELKALGVQTALDDFGTGYSSLSYLEHLPFDKLKIDRAFIMGINNGQKNIGLLRGIVDLAHALGMVVVAEGAELQTEVDILHMLNADSVQGYFFAKPACASEALQKAAEIDSLFQAADPRKSIGGGRSLPRTGLASNSLLTGN